MTQGTWTPPSLIDSLQAALRGKILTGEIPGGTRLTEMDVASQYSVSRPSAKAAVERLVHDGLLQRSTNKTARVPILGLDDIRDLYYARGMLEREVMAELARHKHVPHSATTSLDQLRSLVDAPDLPAVVEADIAFHRALVNALQSRRMTRLYESLAGEVHLCMAQVQAHHLVHPSHIVEEHEAILDAIAAGDVERAVREITEHLDRASKVLTGHLAEQPT